MNQTGTITPLFDKILSEMRTVSTRMMLRRQRSDGKPVESSNAAEDAHEESLQAEDGEKLRELFSTLDGWLSMGGYLPKEWNEARKASKGKAQTRRPDRAIAKYRATVGSRS